MTKSRHAHLHVRQGTGLDDVPDSIPPCVRYQFVHGVELPPCIAYHIHLHNNMTDKEPVRALARNSGAIDKKQFIKTTTSPLSCRVECDSNRFRLCQQSYSSLHPRRQYQYVAARTEHQGPSGRIHDERHLQRVPFRGTTVFAAATSIKTLHDQLPT